MSKPTEGPYTVTDEPRWSGFVIFGANHRIVAKASYDNAANKPQAKVDARLLAKSWEMREALKEIAQQKLSGEMHPEDYEMADFQGGYEACVRCARALLAEIDGTDQ